jgi:hypothetical protein
MVNFKLVLVELVRAERLRTSTLEPMVCNVLSEYHYEFRKKIH